MKLGVVIPCDLHNVKHCVTCCIYKCTDCGQEDTHLKTLEGTDLIFCWNCVTTGIALTKHTSEN